MSGTDEMFIPTELTFPMMIIILTVDFKDPRPLSRWKHSCWKELLENVGQDALIIFFFVWNDVSLQIVHLRKLKPLLDDHDTRD